MIKNLVQFDWAIKHLLRNKTHFPILEGFLSELLHTNVKIDSLLESESNKENAEDKSNRVDILAQLSKGEKVIIEVQCVRQWDFLSRMLYGVSKAVVEHLKKGKPYGALPRVISVNIVYFDLGNGKDYIYRGTTQFKGIHQHDLLELKKREKDFYPEHIDSLEKIFPEYYVLKVGEFDLKIRDTLDEWVYALKQSEVKPEFQAKGIQEAGERLNVLSLSKRERARYESEIEETRDLECYAHTHYGDGFFDGHANGLQEGIEKGIEKGRQEGEAALLLRLLKRRFSQKIPQDYLNLLDQADSTTIAQWSENFIDAKSIEDVFSEHRR